MSPIEHKLRPVYTPRGTEFYCVWCKCISCTWCMFFVSSCPFCVHTHRITSSCSSRLQSLIMETFSSGILLTSHSLTYTVPCKMNSFPLAVFLFCCITTCNLNWFLFGFHVMDINKIVQIGEVKQNKLLV